MNVQSEACLYLPCTVLCPHPLWMYCHRHVHTSCKCTVCGLSIPVLNVLSEACSYLLWLVWSVSIHAVGVLSDACLYLSWTYCQIHVRTRCDCAAYGVSIPATSVLSEVFPCLQWICLSYMCVCVNMLLGFLCFLQAVEELDGIHVQMESMVSCWISGFICSPPPLCLLTFLSDIQARLSGTLQLFDFCAGFEIILLSACIGLMAV